MTRGDAEKAVRERWERLGLNPQKCPIMFGRDVDNMLEWAAEEERVQREYRKQTGETGRSAVQYSDQAQGE